MNARFGIFLTIIVCAISAVAVSITFESACANSDAIIRANLLSTKIGSGRVKRFDFRFKSRVFGGGILTRKLPSMTSVFSGLDLQRR